MSTPQHTPAPWIAVPEPDGPGPGVYSITTQARLDSSWVPICGIDDYWNEPLGSEQTANKRLILAAPDLLAALKALLTAEMMHETAMSHNDESAVEAADEAKWPAVDAAHAAIAKAEGRES